MVVLLYRSRGWALLLKSTTCRLARTFTTCGDNAVWRRWSTSLLRWKRPACLLCPSTRPYRNRPLLFSLVRACPSLNRVLQVNLLEGDFRSRCNVDAEPDSDEEGLEDFIQVYCCSCSHGRKLFRVVVARLRLASPSG